MRIVDTIAKKRDGGTLSKEEIRFFVEGYTNGKIPDYQMAALLMAIYLRGMSPGETTDLTMEMARSGDTVDLSSIPGTKVDKHSTGGVGDKTTLIVGPLVASLGVPVAKMSGRGLGYTGGTVDKLESIPGYRTTLNREEFLRFVQTIGISISGQSGNLAPADKKLYALRDVTGTVENTSLIAASIMSKKIASGADAIVLDVKTGSGAFLKKVEEARQLAMEMVRIGESVGRSTVALITNMNVPLGRAIGNTLEVQESADTLQGKGPADLTALCIELAANMLFLAGKGQPDVCRKLCRNALGDGSAWQKFLEMVEQQGGDVSCLTRPGRLKQAEFTLEVTASEEGYITAMDSQRIGEASMLLGAGRETRDSRIDYTAGIVLLKKPGDGVQAGELIARLHTTERPDMLGQAGDIYRSAVKTGPAPPEREPFFYGRVDKTTV